MNPYFSACGLHPCRSSSSTRWQNINIHHPWKACLLLSQRSKLETPRDYGQCDMRRANLWLKPNPNKESSALKFQPQSDWCLIQGFERQRLLNEFPKQRGEPVWEEEGGVCLPEITGCYFPMPGVILSHGRRLGGGGMARSQGKTKQSPKQSISW